MSNPYSSTGISGYNSGAPPDDGTRTAANQLTWAKHKTKIGDPLKVAIEAINANVLTAFTKGFGNDVTAIGTAYDITVADQGKLFTVTGATTVTLPPPATAGAIFPLAIVNAGTDLVPVSGGGFNLGPGDGAILACNGSAWSALVTRVFPNRVQVKIASYVATLDDIGTLFQFAAVGTLTLPVATANAGHGFRLAVLNTSAGTVTVDGSGAETINGLASIDLSPQQSMELFCTGTAWVATLSGSVQVKHKAADETVNNSVALQDDDHISGYMLEADAFYRISGLLHMSGSVAADLAFRLVFTDAPQKFLLYTDGGSTETPGGLISLNFASTDVFINVNGYIRANAVTGGTMNLQWAQRLAEVSDTKMLEGSWLEIDRT